MFIFMVSCVCLVCLSTAIKTNYNQGYSAIKSTVLSDVKFDVLTRLHTGLYVVRPQLRFNRNKFVSFQFRGVYVR